MKEITRFYGIIIKLLMTKKNSPPCFYAEYDAFRGSFDIQTLEMIEGDLPDRVQLFVKEWGRQYKSEILRMWCTRTLRKLPPLEVV